MIIWAILIAASGASELKMPKHAHPVPNRWAWECDRGYIQHKDECIKVNVPKHGTLNDDGHTWSCKKGFEKYRDVCHKVKK